MAEIQGKGALKAEATVDRVLKELSRVGFSDLRRVLDANGTMLRLKSGMTTQPPPVASVEAVTGNIGDGEVVNVHKFKVWDKNSALENLAKRPRLFIERVEHSGSMSLNVLPEDVEVAHAGSSITEKQREANRILASPARNIMLRGGSRSRKDVRSLSGRAPASDKCSGFAACHSQISVQPREDVCLVRYAAQSSGPLLPVGSGEV